jgi:hypothetical protein
MFIPERVAGFDVGFSQTRKTTGIGLLLRDELVLDRHHAGERAYAPFLVASPFSCIAIDGPLIPRGEDAKARRLVEAVFCRGIFQKRCKPGMSHVSGTGARLRYEAGMAAHRLACATKADGTTQAFPKVLDGAIVEAFPNAFLGVCLTEEVYGSIPTLGRGKKFDWLYERWMGLGQVQLLKSLTTDEQSFFQGYLEKTHDHEKRAAIVCVLTALLTTRGDYTAIGEERGGWFFLPPIENWAPWAKDAIQENITVLRRETGCALRLLQGAGK